MRTIISVIGKDTVGIISKVSSVCSENSVNIIDITQSVLEDMFVMVMLTDISDMKTPFDDFRNQMAKLGEEIGVDIRVMHEDIFNSMHRI